MAFCPAVPLGPTISKPPPTGLMPPLAVALLFRTLLLFITMVAGVPTKMPPPLPATPALVGATVLFWMVLLVMVAKPVPLLVLKMAKPPPSPSVRVLLVMLQLVTDRVAVAGAAPVSKSKAPPNPSKTVSSPRLWPFWMTRFEILTLALVKTEMSWLKEKTLSTLLERSMPPCTMLAGLPVPSVMPTMFSESVTSKVPWRPVKSMATLGRLSV